MTCEQLQELNPRIAIKRLTPASFRPFGRIMGEYDFSELINYMVRDTTIPQEGNIYLASVSEMEAMPLAERLRNEFYGRMPIQIGYCNGPNSTLNGLEYHIGSEIDVAVTDLVLILGRLQDVEEGKFDVSKAEIFFVPAGSALQLYETTLHFAPCKTDPAGFKCIVILPRGTNEPLTKEERGSDPRLFARNKWLLAHPERKPLMDKGAWAGIVGENVEIRIGKR